MTLVLKKLEPVCCWQGKEVSCLFVTHCRAYKKSAKGTFDDAAYFDGQYASQMKPEQPKQRREADFSSGNSMGGVSTAQLDIRNPLRKQSRQQS